MTNCGRRELLLGAAAALALHSPAVWAHSAAGVVNPPQPAPATKLTLEDGAVTSLPALLKDRVTALQLIFTSCQATCPIQGALFADAAQKLGTGHQLAQLLSISIDPDRDTPAVLREWLKRFGASPRWRAAQPDKGQLEALTSFLKSKVAGPDPHTAQVYYFDRKGQLVLRSVDFPPAADVVKSLEQLAGKRAK
jgi:protein SCO1